MKYKIRTNRPSYSTKFSTPQVALSLMLLFFAAFMTSGDVAAQGLDSTSESNTFIPFLSGAESSTAQSGPSDAGDNPHQGHAHHQHGETVVKVYYTSPEDVHQLADRYDVWEEAISSQPYVTILASDTDIAELSIAGYKIEVDEALTASIIPFDVWKAQANDPSQIVRAARVPGYACYRTVEETYSDLSQLAVDNPSIASWIDIGDSWDKQTGGGPAGYDIYALKLTNSQIAGPKPALMIISAIHAREYTTAEMNSRFAEYLVNNYGSDPDVTWLLDYHEVHILAQANPDGRKMAEGGLLWRKNTNPTNGCTGGSNYGVDLNRNSSFQWGGSGSSSNTCSQIYRGPSPKSEPEVQAIQDYATALFPDQRGPGLNDPAPPTTEGVFISIHSYSELVLFPWGWSTSQGPNQSSLATLGRKFGYHTGYRVCNPGSCLYIADGTTDDWSYGELGVASYTFELGTSFFQDCPTFEDQIYPDNLKALLYAAKAARRPYQTPSGPDAINLTVSQSQVEVGTAVTLNARLDDTRHNSNGEGTEPRQNIQAARYTIDLPSWRGGTTYPMNAADGNLNSSAENMVAQVDTSGLTEGQHTIFVEGQDAAGNWGVPTAIFFEVEGLSGPPDPNLGDVNCDDSADTIDALFVMQYVVGMRTDAGGCPLSGTVAELNAASGDVNNNGVTDTIDALFMMQCVVGIENVFCPAE